MATSDTPRQSDTVTWSDHPARTGHWDRLGFEVELLAPSGASRHTLAEEFAEQCGGSIRTVFHHDAEPSLVEGRPVFHHLTRGFEVDEANGAMRCRLVDDVTINTDLDIHKMPEPGWFRILSDEPRLLRLAQQICDPTASAESMLGPMAAAFGSAVEALDGNRFRLDDRGGDTIAMIAPQGGERERVCEIVTPPLTGSFEDALEALLGPARDLGFTIPAEAAVHIHLDAEPFRTAPALARLIELFSERDALWSTLGTNQACRRLSPLPPELVDGVRQPGFTDRSWPEVLMWLRTIPLTKYCDLNLVNLRKGARTKDTVEIRILPGADNPGQILAGLEELKRALP